MSFDGAPETGWVVAPWAQGKGYALEAMTAVLAWSDRAYPRTVCIIDPDNHPSRRLAAKCGYRDRERLTYHGAEVILLERDRR